MRVLYDTIGEGYTDYRRADPRIAAAITRTLGNAETIINIGAGAGSYEPCDRQLVAVEPSPAMLAQRRTGAAPAVQAFANRVPFRDRSFDAAMAILTVHHWRDQSAGLLEMRRVARKRCVILTWEEPEKGFWLTRDYFPEILEYDRTIFSLALFRAVFGAIDVRPLPVPHDCTDGFLCAYWRRPEMYLDARARQAISSFSRLQEVPEPLHRLRRDLDDGTWERRNAEILARTEMDFGYRLITAELER